jgi:hypothetical protein
MLFTTISDITDRACRNTYYVLGVRHIVQASCDVSEVEENTWTIGEHRLRVWEGKDVFH